MAVAGLVVVTIVVAAVLARSDTDQEPTAAGPVGALHSALCAVRSTAAKGESAEARWLFANRHHQWLHLAASAGDTARTAAARLLEAEEAVERDLATASAELVGDLDHLLSATSNAIALTGRAQPAPCREES